MTIFPCPLFPLAEHSRLGQHTLETSIWLSACVSIQAVCQMAGSRFKTACPGLHRLRKSYLYRGTITLSVEVSKKEMAKNVFPHQAWLRLGVIWLFPVVQE